jgi:hypothetical protein
MTFQGHVENGRVILNQPLALPDGTPVLVEPMTDVVNFWQSCSLDSLAEQQGVSPLRSPDDLLGGWPADEIDDNFEATLYAWREGELEHQA